MTNRIAAAAAALMLVAQLAFLGAVQAADKRTPAAASAGWTDGEIVRINKDAPSLTIKHGPMPKFNMPGMTMPYKVKDKSAIDQLKVGDKIRFDAEDVGGTFTVVRLEKVK